MGDKSKIEWTDATWNPFRGCSRVSPGCENCYAERVAHRFSKPGEPYEGLTILGNNGPRWNGQVRFIPEHLEDPLRWKKPRMIFVNSMSDLFHENLSFQYIEDVFRVMREANWHTFQVLTKRPKVMNEFIRWYMVKHSLGDDFYILFKHVWFGISAENQKTFDERVPVLIDTPAAVRILSLEPLLGPIHLNLDERWCRREEIAHECEVKGDHLHWVIVGGESGPGARPIHEQWVQDIRDECVEAGVPFFFKQWGEWLPWCQDDHNENGNEKIKWDASGFYQPIHVWKKAEDGSHYIHKGACEFRYPEIVAKVGKANAGRLLDGREWNEYPVR